MSKTIAIVASATVGLLIIGGVVATTVMAPADRFEACRTTRTAGTVGGPFTLVNAAGETVTDAQVITKPSLIYFGYTFCPDVCPLDVARNVEAVDILAEQGLEVQPVFISIDPERDTPEVVGDFAANMHPQMVGLTGSPEQVKAASQAYKTFYQKQDGDPDYYLVNHSTSSYLVFPDDGFVQFFSRALRPDQMAEQLECFLQV
ncbi:SCO family protein [Algirhabdus cladophorae]|uniref:SCO family protein n=1 Tax=Algirhabdus cladophorae TaxID=3377108 RepID=UPI003B849495